MALKFVGFFEVMLFFTNVFGVRMIVLYTFREVKTPRGAGRHLLFKIKLQLFLLLTIIHQNRQFTQAFGGDHQTIPA